jgi:hypothetical protein
MTAMVFSPQQVKFEFLSYIKEFGGSPEEWRIGCGADAETALFDENLVDRERDIWLWKPMLSPAAATIVLRYMSERFRVQIAENSTSGPILYIYKKEGE